MYRVLKDGQPPVKPEASGCQNPEIIHHSLNRIITIDSTFHHRQLV